MTANDAVGLRSLPVFRDLLDDSSVPLVARAIDMDWVYAKQVSHSIVGWNPFAREVYHGGNSMLAAWLRQEREGADEDERLLNQGDHLSYEVLFAAHDYLHIWATGRIRAHWPEFGCGPLTADDLERAVFGMLMAETVATIGLDYWYLSLEDCAHLSSIGSARRNLATSWRREFAHEYAKAGIAVDPASRDFFAFMARFYCTGVWPDADVDGLMRSARTQRWLEHELAYGARQRSYSRTWLAWLGAIALDPARAAAPVATPSGGETIVEDLADGLWRAMRMGEPLRVEAWDVADAWHRPAQDEGPIDFRFTNVAALGPDPAEALAARGVVPGSHRFLVEQLVSRHEFQSAPSYFMATIPWLKLTGSWELALTALGGLRRAGEPEATRRDMFFLG